MSLTGVESGAGLPIDWEAAAAQALLEEGFVPSFPPEVIREVSSMREAEPEAPPAPAVDLRRVLWSSIDNRESRDLDQLEVVEPLPQDGLRLRVAVADVDARVGRGSATDAHAAANTTSVYAGVAVFPMLPERLSSDLTSLGPGEDRLAVVVEIDIDETGRASRHEVYRAQVRNHAQLDYDTVGNWLEGSGPPPPATMEIPDLEGQLRLQAHASRRLLAFRRRVGVLDLESIEAQPVVAGRKVIDLRTIRRDPARDIVESFMVAANTALAGFLSRHGMPALRRVVRVPKRWDRIVTLAAELRETLPAEPDSRALAAFLARRRSKDPLHFPDLSLAVVKLLGSGEYVAERRAGGRRGEGHFALGAAEYAHGTAPNRRFPDLVLQRLVKHTLARRPSPYTDDELMEIARHCTEREDAARKVERRMRKRAAAALVADRIGQDFVAVVTGASPKGTYVRVLSPPVEGRVVRGHQGLDVGDTVRVRLLSADARLGHIDFEGPRGDLGRKLQRSRQKKQAAARLLGREGQSFVAIITSASPKGTYVRLPRERVEGRVVRGHRPLVTGQHVTVRLLEVDSVHGFIDFEYPEGLEPRKIERLERKRRIALALRGRIGDRFDGVVTGANPKATWVRLRSPDVEGRLVRGRGGLRAGDFVRMVLLAADPLRGHIDLARDE
jgi:exoribonuclease R